MTSNKFKNNCIKYIIFDMDGVLINSEPVTMRAASKALAEIGIAADKSDFEPYIGAGEDKFIFGLCRKLGKDSLAEGALARLYEIFGEIVADELFVFPSVHMLLETLAEKGFKMAIASSSNRGKLDQSLDAAHISQDLFETIISGSDVSEKKPSPEIYIKTMQKLGAKPEQCLIIEDATLGVQAAKAAGAYCFAVTTSFDSAALHSAGADFIGNDIAEVLDILN